MDPIRRKLVELRDWIASETEPTRCVVAQSEWLGRQTVLHSLEEILADWDAADEIRPREPTDRMIGAGILAYDGRSETAYRAMWDAYKQERE